MKRLLLLLLLIPSLCFAGQGMGPGPGVKGYDGGGGSTPVAYVNSNSAYDAGPATLTGVTAGHALVLFVSTGDGLSADPSGGCTGSWSAVATFGDCNSSGTLFNAFVCLNASGGSASVTLPTSHGGDPGWSLHEYANAATSSAIDGTPSASCYAGANPTISGPTTGQNNSMIFIGCADESSTTSLTNSYNTRTTEATHWHQTMDHLQATAGAASMTTTRGASASLGCVMFGLKAANP